jgi:hypothetical protein
MNFSRSFTHGLRVTTATFFNRSHHGVGRTEPGHADVRFG